jgi:hypothetical protein
VLDWQDDLLVLQGLPKPVKKASLLVGGRPVKLQLLHGGLLLDLPKTDRDPIDTVVVLES